MNWLREDSSDQHHQLILVVDDDAVTRDTLAIILESAGYEVCKAKNGEEGLVIAEQEQPDLILLDVVMTGLDGYSTCYQIRQLEYARHIPIIMLTALNDTDSAEKAFSAGATDFINKPINWTLLIQRLKYAFRSYHTQQALLEQQFMLKKAQQTARLTYIEIDERLETIHFSPDLHHLFNIDIPGDHCSVEAFQNIVHPDDSDNFINAITRSLTTGMDVDIEYRLVNMDGSVLAIHQNTSPRIKNNQRSGLVATLQDITEQERARSLIEYRTFYDNVTDLPNLRLLQEDMDSLLGDPEEDALTAIVYINLDRFEEINRTLGYEKGNRLLRYISKRLEYHVNDYTRLYRTGGQSFVILAQQRQDIDGVIEFAYTILNSLSHPYQYEAQELNISASLGIVLYPLDNSDRDSLLKHAESAAAMAKQDGGNRYQFHTEAMQEMAEQRLAMESDLRKAIKNNQLFLYYQPQIDVKTQSVIGMECLIRWHHPEKGLVSPFEFIPLAEEIGLINDIGVWIMREAFQNTRYWHQQGYHDLRVSINLSTRQFEQDGLLDILKSTLQLSGLNPACVELEITETAAMVDFERTLSILKEFKSLGVKSSIDDFGTGHSSLGYLQRLPVDTLKIDRAFIKDIGTDKDDGTLAKTIITMAHNFQLNVIAEGVETTEQLQFLQDSGCDEIQGFLFSRPLPGDEFSEYLANPKTFDLPVKIKSVS